MSAGRLLVPGIRDGTSSLGARAADCAAEKRMSLRQSCLWIQFPFPPQPTWWSPKGSAALSPTQRGHLDSPSLTHLQPKPVHVASPHIALIPCHEGAALGQTMEPHSASLQRGGLQMRELAHEKGCQGLRQGGSRGRPRQSCVRVQLIYAHHLFNLSRVWSGSVFSCRCSYSLWQKLHT